MQFLIASFLQAARAEAATASKKAKTMNDAGIVVLALLSAAFGACVVGSAWMYKAWQNSCHSDSHKEHGSYRKTFDSGQARPLHLFSVFSTAWYLHPVQILRFSPVLPHLTHCESALLLSLALLS